MVKEQLGHRESAELDYAAVAGHADVARAGWYWVVRGTNLAALGQFERAEECHRTALACNDVDEAEARLNLGYVLRAQGRYDEAAEAFRQCMRTSPANAEAAEAIGTLKGVGEAIAVASATPEP